MRLRGAAVALVLLMGCWQTARATPTETGETGLVTMPTTGVLAPWKFHLGVYENGELGDSSPKSNISLWRTEFVLGIGLLPNLEFTSMIPYIQFTRDVPTDRHTDAAGGLRLGLKYRLLDESKGAPLSVAFLGALVVGTGRNSFPAILDRNSAWGGRETFEVMGIADKVLWTMPAGADATLTVNAGGLFFDQPASFAVQNQSFQFQRRFSGPNATFDNPFEFGVGLKVPVFANKSVEADLLGEYRGNTAIVEEVSGALPTRLFTGGRLAAANGLALQFGADFGLSGFLDPNRFLLGLTYARPGEPPPAPVVQAAPAAVPAPAAPPPAPAATKKIVLRGVNFAFNKATIQPDSVPILRATASTLKQNSSVHMLIVGHTDSKGTPAYNDRLGLQRAIAVRDTLEKLGVRANRMSVESKGEGQPVASNDTEEGRAQNRRVELIVQP